jgi:hypothetical protein
MPSFAAWVDIVSKNCDREDGKLKCGYSSFRGKRATMEDFYDVKLTEIDGQAVSLFGVFDGMVYNLAFSTPPLLAYHVFTLQIFRSWRVTCCRVFEGTLVRESYEAPQVLDRYEACYK